jgi:hypothetical protein
VLHQIWIVSGTREITPFTVLGTRTWAGGVSFGARKMLEVVPLFLPAVISAATSDQRLRRIFAVAALVAVVPTALLSIAAILDPVRTTGSLHAGAGFVALFGVAFDPGAWATALKQRSLPIGVGLGVLVIVATPLLAALVVQARRAARLDPAGRVSISVGVVIGAAVFANLWTSMLLIRSETILADHPDRTERLRDPWGEAHRATVKLIPEELARKRAVLGEHAVP